MKNIFERIADAKAIISKFSEMSKINNWLSEADFEKIKHNLDKEKITIGVVGQMKNGKSTLVNALIFEDSVLPSATTPMTSSLSIISYGNEPKIEVEFYSFDEWNALLDLSKSNSNNDALVQAAIDIVKKAKEINDDIEDILKIKKTTIEFNEIEDYVGANGKYVPITLRAKP